MNASKSLTFASALFISIAGIAGIRAYANAAVHARLPIVTDSTIQPIQVMPAIVVRPSPEDYRRAFGHASVANTSTTTRTKPVALGSTGIDMPYYSFAAKPVVGVR